MGFLLKPAFLQNAASAADVQRLMKADLKNNVGKKAVKFVAAKNCVIGGKTIHLFILTDTPALFETVLKTKYPKAYRAKGACDVAKDTDSGAIQVLIKSSSGQMLPDAVAKLMPLVVAGDKNFVAQVALKGSPSDLKPVGKVDSGVAEWAKKEYREKARQVLIASMTPDRKIGSVYFDDGSRIRTTHGSGPSGETHSGKITVQFNINENQSVLAFRKRYRNPNPKTKAEAKTFWDDYDAWLLRQLKDVNIGSVPSWAKLVQGPDTAHDLSTGSPAAVTRLVELFKNINGQLEGWHPSRGTATKFVTDKQTVSVLQAGIKLIDAEAPLPKPLPTDPVELKRIYALRNTKFYNFVKSRLPNSEIMKAMRDPSTV